MLRQSDGTHKTQERVLQAQETQEKTIKELSSKPAGARSEAPLRQEEGQRGSQGPRKRRKSVTETVTRTVVIETEGSPSSDPDEKTII